MKHTPTPWHWVEDKYHGGFKGIESCDEIVLQPNCCNDGDEGAAWFEAYPSEEDMDFIIRACNSYDEMLEALRAVLLEPTIGQWQPGRAKTIRAAIAKATGKGE